MAPTRSCSSREYHDKSINDVLVKVLFMLVLMIVPYSEAVQVTIVTVKPWEATLLASSELQPTNISVKLMVLDIGKTGSSYDRIDKTYKTLELMNPHAVIAPYDTAIGLVTEALKIPYLTMSHVAKKGLGYTTQVIPELKRTSEAMLGITQIYQWDKVSVFYDSDDGVEILERLMTNHTLTVRAWRLARRARRKQVRDSLVEMRKVLVEKSIVFCNRENTYLLLDEGNEMRTLFNKYTDIAVNFTIVSVVAYNSSVESKGVSPYGFTLATDALNLVTASYPLVQTTAAAATSGNENRNMSHYMMRDEINRAVRNNMIDGLTGNLEFDENGKRVNYTLTLTTVTGSESYLRGIWYTRPYVNSDHLVLFDEQHPANRSTPFPLKGRVARVVMIEEKPFTMLKRDHMLRTGNSRYEGFAVDLIDEVAKMLGFDYEIYLVNDGKFGSKMPNGEWNGIIGELLSGNATLSVAPLSINSEREEVIDFTKPFKTRYISDQDPWTGVLLAKMQSPVQGPWAETDQTPQLLNH